MYVSNVGQLVLFVRQLAEVLVILLHRPSSTQRQIWITSDSCTRRRRHDFNLYLYHLLFMTRLQTPMSRDILFHSHHNRRSIHRSSEIKTHTIPSHRGRVHSVRTVLSQPAWLPHSSKLENLNVTWIWQYGLGVPTYMDMDHRRCVPDRHCSVYSDHCRVEAAPQDQRRQGCVAQVCLPVCQFQ